MLKIIHCFSEIQVSLGTLHFIWHPTSWASASCLQLFPVWTLWLLPCVLAQESPLRRITKWEQTEAIYSELAIAGSQPLSFVFWETQRHTEVGKADSGKREGFMDALMGGSDMGKPPVSSLVWSIL